MESPAPIDLAAARLRQGDVLVSYGDHARIVRHPVISLDGSMISVLVECGPETDQVRLVRLPVGLSVEVRRPHATGGAPFVRGSKVARSSGARIMVLDLHHPDSEIPPQAGEEFATVCTVHHTFTAHPGISTAQAQATHPEQWCHGCADATKARAHERVYGAAGKAAGSKDIA